eukprot:gene13051-13153_t
MPALALSGWRSVLRHKVACFPPAKMTGRQAAMKGVIFNLLEDVVTAAHGAQAWPDLVDAAGVDGVYTSLGSYPDAEILALVDTAAAIQGQSPATVLRWFGRGALPLLALRFPEFFVRHHTARSFIATANDIIHPEVRKLYAGARCPHFHFTDADDGRLLIGYQSPRRIGVGRTSGLHDAGRSAVPPCGSLAGMKTAPIALPDPATGRIERLERQLLRERKARLAAEAIAEDGLRALYESKRYLALLQRITERANKADTLTEALSFTLGEICAELGWDFGNAYLVRSMQEAVPCNCWHVANPEHLMPFVEASRELSFARGVGLPGRVLAEPRPWWIEDVRTDTNFQRHDVAIDCRVVAGCAFPVMAGSEVVAIYEFFSRKGIEAEPAVVETIAQIGIQLGRVAEREQAREALLRDALHDPLTTLPNRILLHERASSAFSRLPRNAKGLAVLVIDLDGFKAVNDKLGHHAGDCLLVAAAARLRDAIDECVGGESVVRGPTEAPAGTRNGIDNTGTPGADLPFVSVNIAPQQFLLPDFVPYLRGVIMETGVPPSCLKLEVTEGVAVLDAERFSAERAADRSRSL